MNISGIRPSVGFYDYNEIKIQTGATPVQAEPQSSVSPVADKPVVTERSPEVEARQTFGAYDYASQYNPNTTYSMKGEESDIRSLDVQKAVSDMQKDEVIHQYQYFVGQEMGINANQVPNVRGAEDFSL